MTNRSDNSPGRAPPRESRAAGSPHRASSSALRAIIGILARQAAREAFAERERERDAIADSSTLE